MHVPFAVRATSASLVLAGLALANELKDDKHEIAYQNTGSGNHTCQVKNTSPTNDNITAVVYNADGTIAGWITIEKDSSVPVTCPQGGRIEVDDRDYTGTQGNPTVTNDSNAANVSYDIT